MSYVYRADGEPSDEEITSERQAIATVGYSAIRSWHTPPDIGPDGTVDVDRLRAWITESRRLLAVPMPPRPIDQSIINGTALWTQR